MGHLVLLPHQPLLIDRLLPFYGRHLVLLTHQPLLIDRLLSFYGPLGLVAPPASTNRQITAILWSLGLVDPPASTNRQITAILWPLGLVDPPASTNRQITARRPCSDSRHVTAPYKLALYYYSMGHLVLLPHQPLLIDRLLPFYRSLGLVAPPASTNRQITAILWVTWSCCPTSHY